MISKDVFKDVIANYPLGRSDTEVETIGALPIHLKLVNTSGIGSWLIAEANDIGNDVILFGLCTILESELGLVSLNELNSIGTIEVDTAFKPKLLREAVAEDSTVDYDLAY